MEISHRITFSNKDQVDDILEKLHIKFKKSPLPGQAYLLHIDIAEDDHNWSEVTRLAQEKCALDIVWTKFSDEEILSADWVRIIPNFESGYAEPKDLGWLQTSFDCPCSQCTVGCRQKAPLQLISEPRISRHEFFSPFGTYALCCTNLIFQVLQANRVRGYEQWKVLSYKTGKPLPNLSQIIIPGVSYPGLADEDKIQPEKCAICQLIKYAHFHRGYMRMKKGSLLQDTDFQLTNEWFGSGGRTAYREIIASHRVAVLVIGNRWHGVALKPIELI
jgi:hypothetical protein